MSTEALQVGEILKKLQSRIDDYPPFTTNEQTNQIEKPKATNTEITEENIYNLLTERITKNEKELQTKKTKGENKYIDYIDSLQLYYRKILLDLFEENKPNNKKTNPIFNIKKWLKQSKTEDLEKLHEKISADVFRRLRLRNAQLRELEEQARSYLVNNELNFKTTNSDKDNNSSSFGIRAYHLAVTDLFVEKAIAYLEERANEYKIKGEKMIRNGQRAYIFGAILAFLSVIPIQIENNRPFNIQEFNIKHTTPKLIEELTEDRDITTTTKNYTIKDHTKKK